MSTGARARLVAAGLLLVAVTACRRDLADDQASAPAPPPAAEIAPVRESMTLEERLERLSQELAAAYEGRLEGEALGRMLRAVRFAAQLRFRIDGATLAAVRRHAELLDHVSAERIRDEFSKLLLAPEPAPAREPAATCRVRGPAGRPRRCGRARRDPLTPAHGRSQST